MDITKLLDSWRPFGIGTGVTLLVCAVLGSAIDKNPAASIVDCIGIWMVVNFLYLLFYALFMMVKGK